MSGPIVVPESDVTALRRFREAVRVRPNLAAMGELRTHLVAWQACVRGKRERTACGALQLLIEMYDRIRKAELGD